LPGRSRSGHPPISGHIRNLESFVGTPLLDRFPRHIVMTQAGRLLYRYGRSIINEKKSAERELKQLTRDFSGAQCPRFLQKTSVDLEQYPSYAFALNLEFPFSEKRRRKEHGRWQALFV
jgi:DNA-binding transcriptional LysR family regulator